MESAKKQHQFCDIKLESLSIEECAKSLGASGATIRNWIKTGYLFAVSKGQVSSESVEKFKSQISGKEKLNQRANKSRKDSHDHEFVMSEFLEKVRVGIKNSDFLGEDYESSLSDSYRNKEGIYYTPTDIVHDLLTIKNENLENKSICDPCCGSGNFLIRALEIGFKPENIFGFDIDQVAVEIAKKRIYEKTGFLSENIKLADFLELSISNKIGSYDYIFTNPPWGKKIEKIERESISKILKAGNSLDTCSLFYFSCINALNLNGKLGFLLPEAFFNVATYEDARVSTLSYQIEKLSYYGKPFKGLLTGAVGIVLNKMNPNEGAVIDCLYEKIRFQRDVLSFQKNPKSIINISCTPDDAEVISHIYSIPHLTLNGYGKWGLGIVTGNNEKFIESSHRKGLIPVYKGSDITKNGLKPASNYIPEDFSHYQQVAPINLYKAREKLIYKFISSNLCFFYDTNGHFIINSANMLIINEDFPVSMKIIADLLNSDFMNWVFKKIFNTHKILRGDLESLPIHAQFLSGDNFLESEYLASINIERTSNGTFRIKR